MSDMLWENGKNNTWSMFLLVNVNKTIIFLIKTG